MNMIMSMDCSRNKILSKAMNVYIFFKKSLKPILTKANNWSNVINKVNKEVKEHTYKSG